MTVESLDWSAIAQFLLAVAALAVTTFLIPYLRQKLGAQKAEQVEDLIWQLVQAAEQIFGPDAGAQKKAYVVQQLEAQGIDAAAHDADIEAAVLQAIRSSNEEDIKRKKRQRRDMVLRCLFRTGL